MRKLASIQKIKDIYPIEGADFLEVATVQGWQVVVKKGEFAIGDLCVYFEIDSILPEKPWSEFMRQRKFRVKTIKLRKQVSQGLALPMEILGKNNQGILLGTDVTDLLGVTKHDPAGDKERRAHAETRRNPPPHSWMLKYSLGRRLHQRLYPRASGSWPEFMRWV